MPIEKGAWTEDGFWRPWRHPDYRSPAHDLQGWWQKRATDEVIAVLGPGGISRAGNELLTCAKYDFNQGTRGSGFRMGASRLKREYDREPDDRDPRQ